MVTGWLKYCVFSLAMIALQPALAQHLTSSVSVNTSRVYVGEPVEVTVSVFTSTWFTSGLDIQNIKVNGAFTVPFRTLSTSKSIKGKTYAGVQFFYNVFPYSEEDIEFPSLTIEVETPDDGDYKGKKRNVKTKARTIKVRPIPPGFEKSEWLVTPNLTTRDVWSGNLNNVKVGDVLTRSIHRDAALTVSELIPPITWDSIEGVSYYPDRSVTQNNKTKTSFSAERSDVVRYLFLKEGEVIIPEITLMWWNAARKKVYKRTLKARTIHVLPNPDLGMVTSIKDSLDAVAQINSEQNGKEEFLLWGEPLAEWVKRILVAFITWQFVIRFLVPVSSKLNSAYSKYRVSERYYFNQIIWAKLGWKSSRLEVIQYRWLDEIDLSEPTLELFWHQFGSGSTKSILGWIKARRKYFSSKQKINRSNWINPQ